MASLKFEGYSVGVLVVSDTVSRGEKVDLSGKNLEIILSSGKYFPAKEVAFECISDDIEPIKLKLIEWSEKLDLILTVGGTGFSERDITPEATKAVIQKDAAHLASYMIINCASKTKFATLSRSVCGIRGRCLILNLPGSKKGSEECFEVVASILPHAMDQLKSDAAKVISKHIEIQGSEDNRLIL